MHQLYNQVEREEAKYHYDTITETHNSQQSMLSVKGYCFFFVQITVLRLSGFIRIMAFLNIVRTH